MNKDQAELLIKWMVRVAETVIEDQTSNPDYAGLSVARIERDGPEELMNEFNQLTNLYETTTQSPIHHSSTH